MATDDARPLAAGTVRHEDAISRSTRARFTVEHAYIGHVLDVLDRELESIRRDEQVDYELATAAVKYLTFNDRSHHAREDFSLRVLVEREPNWQAAVEDLEAEHELLAATGKRFDDLLGEVVLSDAPIARDLIFVQGLHYVRLLRAHIEEEEQRLFHVLAAHLDADDWARIDGEHPGQEDPLFGEVVQPSFVSLRDALRGPVFR